MSTEYVYPTGIGTYDAWTSSTAGNKWDDVNDEVGNPDDASGYLYATDAVNGQQNFTFAPIAIAVSIGIDYVRHHQRGYRTAVGATTSTAYLRVGTTNRAAGVNANLTNAWADYTQDWITNPNTGVAWTEEEIEQTDPTTTHRLNEFGFLSSPAAGRESEITQCYLEVVYDSTTAIVLTANCHEPQLGGSSF